MANWFIVLEGIDGCGKGAQTKRLHNYIFDSDKRNEIFSTREPTYGKYGEKIRDILKTDKDPHSNADLLLNLYSKDREEHLEIINKIMSRKTGQINHFVLCERYYHSTYAYQQTQKIDFEKIHEIQKKFLKPDITFILDLKPEIAYSRICNGRTNSEKFEKLEFMEELRKNFLDLKNKLNEKIEIIDASKSKEDVFKQILKVLKENKIVN